jgi:hypothetical protein
MKVMKELLNAGLPLGRKLFEEIDKLTRSKIVFDDISCANTSKEEFQFNLRGRLINYVS